MWKKYRYWIQNLDCAACAKKIEDALNNHPNYQNVNVNFSTLNLSFETSIETNVVSSTQKIIQKIEPNVLLLENHQNLPKRKISFDLGRLGIGIFFAILAMMTNGLVSTFCYVIAYAILLFRTVKNAISLLKNKTINENFLITISCIGAYLVGQEKEGLMVIFLYEIGKILEDFAVANTRKSVAELMDIRPESANLKVGDHYEIVKPEAVKKEDVILIKVGEKVPLDGIIRSGESEIDTSSLTGESILKTVKVGDMVLSGSVNVTGALEMEVTETYENSTVLKILNLIENATDKKAKTETFVSKAAKIYTPVVLGLSILLALFLPIVTSISYQEAIYRALTFLVISCPCAIAISVPLAYFSGIGAASRKGILIKGSDFLDSLRNIKTVVFDKTGTITHGEFQVEKIACRSNFTEDQVYTYAYYGEQYSNHPLAKAILSYQSLPPVNTISKVKEFAGKGIQYEWEGKKIKVGNQDFVQDTQKEVGTRIFVSINEEVIGTILLSDRVKEDSKKAIVTLKNNQIMTYMFTGDQKEIAQEIGQQVGIDQVQYEMLPTDKYTKLETLLQHNNGIVAFVGDGINDAPVLALADIGVSMGLKGSNAAIEASDVVIMNDHLTLLPEAIAISKKTHRIILQNLVFAIGTKILVLILAAVGISSMWQAVFADVGVTLITILNTMRILKRQ